MLTARFHTPPEVVASLIKGIAYDNSDIEEDDYIFVNHSGSRRDYCIVRSDARRIMLLIGEMVKWDFCGLIRVE